MKRNTGKAKLGDIRINVETDAPFLDNVAKTQDVLGAKEHQVEPNRTIDVCPLWKQSG